MKPELGRRFFLFRIAELVRIRPASPPYQLGRPLVKLRFERTDTA